MRMSRPLLQHPKTDKLLALNKKMAYNGVKDEQHYTKQKASAKKQKTLQTRKITQYNIKNITNQG